MKEDILEHAQKRANALRELWARLRIKYNELDAIMGELTFIPTFSLIFKMKRLINFLFPTASVTGNSYSNPMEMQTDAELEVCRQIRDKLGGAVEQWRTSANLLRTSAKSALVAKEHYESIQTSR